MRRALTALLMACTAGCFTDAMSGSSTVTGKYALRTINGSALPFATSQSANGRTEIVGDTISLFGTGTYARSVLVRATVDGQPSTQRRLETGNYNVFGTSVSFQTSDGAPVKQAMLTGARLTFIESGMTSVYVK